MGQFALRLLRSSILGEANSIRKHTEKKRKKEEMMSSKPFSCKRAV